jgi:hypothetical protein
MEGPMMRNYPRLLQEVPVELHLPKAKKHLKSAATNLSAGGLYVTGPSLPVGTPVHVKVSARHPFEADGVVRYSEANGGRGAGIEFTRLTAAKRRHLDALIKELTRAGAPAC